MFMLDGMVVNGRLIDSWESIRGHLYTIHLYYACRLEPETGFTLYCIPFDWLLFPVSLWPGNEYIPLCYWVPALLMCSCFPVPSIIPIWLVLLELQMPWQTDLKITGLSLALVGCFLDRCLETYT